MARDVLIYRRADGREISLEKLPLAQALSAGETVRVEEMVVRVSGGPSVTMLVNASPVFRVNLSINVLLRLRTFRWEVSV